MNPPNRALGDIHRRSTGDPAACVVDGDRSTQSITIVRIYCSDGTWASARARRSADSRYGEEVRKASNSRSIRISYRAAGRRCAPAIAMKADCHGDRPAIISRSARGTALMDAQGKGPIAGDELLGGRLRTLTRPLDAFQRRYGARHRGSRGDDCKRRHNTFKLKIGKRSLGRGCRATWGRSKSPGEPGERAGRPQHGLGRVRCAACGSRCWRRRLRPRLEQPIDRLNRAGMARLAAPQSSNHGGRGAARPKDAYDFAVRRGADVFSVKIAQSGGLIAAKESAGNRSRRRALQLYAAPCSRAGIGTIASAHVSPPFPNWLRYRCSARLLLRRKFSPSHRLRRLGMPCPMHPV